MSFTFYNSVIYFSPSLDRRECLREELFPFASRPRSERSRVVIHVPGGADDNRLSRMILSSRVEPRYTSLLYNVIASDDESEVVARTWISQVLSPKIGRIWISATIIEGFYPNIEDLRTREIVERQLFYTRAKHFVLINKSALSTLPGSVAAGLNFQHTNIRDGYAALRLGRGVDVGRVVDAIRSCGEKECFLRSVISTTRPAPHYRLPNYVDAIVRSVDIEYRIELKYEYQKASSKLARIFKEMHLE